MTISNQTRRVITVYPGGAGPHTFSFDFPIFDEGDLLVVTLNPTTGVESTKTLGVHYQVTLSGAVPSAGFVQFIGGSPAAAGDLVSIILDPPEVQETAFTNKGRFPSAAVETALDKLLNLVKRAQDLASRSLRQSDGSSGAMIGGLTLWNAQSGRLTNLSPPTASSDAATKSYVDAEVAAATLDPTTTVSPYAVTLLDDADAAAAQATLGALATGSDLFESANVNAAMGVLGYSTFMRDMRTMADAAAARVYVNAPSAHQVYRRNHIVNGDFQVWQHGTTFNSTTPVGGGNNNNVYFADQWILQSDGNDRVDITRSRTDVGAGAKASAVFNVQVGNTRFAAINIVESVDVIPLREKECSFSVQMRAAGSLTDFSVFPIYWTGTADAPTRPIITGWGGVYNETPTWAAGWAAVSGGAINLTATSTMQKFDFLNGAVTAFEMPATANNFALVIVTADPAFTAGAIATLTGVQLVESPTHVDFPSKSLDEEIALCERFYQKTFELEVPPAQNIGNVRGALICKARTADIGNLTLEFPWRFTRRMRTTPAVTSYNPQGLDSAADSIDSADTSAVTIVGEGDSGVTIISGPTAKTALEQTEGYAVHASADARF